MPSCPRISTAQSWPPTSSRTMRSPERSRSTLTTTRGTARPSTTLRPCRSNRSICSVLLPLRSLPALPAEQDRERVPHRARNRTHRPTQNDNLKKKTINAHVGDARFWKAIDDSFESTEIAKVQKHVGDSEPTQFELRTSKVELEVDSEGRVVNVHPKH